MTSNEAESDELVPDAPEDDETGGGKGEDRTDEVLSPEKPAADDV